MNNRRNQSGVYLVEFAVVGAVFLFMVFGAMEVARVMYTWSALNAMTQRGARVAAVCAVDDDLIAQVAVFGQAGDMSSPIVVGMTPAEIDVDYLDVDGAVLDTSVIANRNLIEYVRVGILQGNEGYKHQMLIPELITGFISPLLDGLAFQTTRPRESLGYVPDTGNNTCPPVS